MRLLGGRFGKVREASPTEDARRQYENLVASIDGIVWEADARTFQFNFVSRQAQRLLGYPPEDWLVPGFWVEHVHPEDRSCAVEFCVQATRAGQRHELEYRMVAADGRAVWLRDYVTVIMESGEPTKLCGVMVDITERKKAEEVHQSHVWVLEGMDRVNRAIQSTDEPEPMMGKVLDAVLAILGCDRAWLLYPCDPEAASWNVPMERTRPEYPGAFALGIDLPVDEDVARAFRAALASEGPVRYGPGSEQPIPPETARHFGIQSMMAMAIYPRVGRPYAFGIHQCSRPREWRPHEERLFQAIGWRLADALTSVLVLRNLRESEARLAEAQRLAHVGYWDRDLVADHILWSDETYRILGLQPQERSFRFPEFLELIHPEDRDAVASAAAQALAGGPRYDVEYRVVRPDGSFRTVRSQGDLTRDGTGKPRRVFGSVQDVTELKRLEEGLRQAQKMEAVGRLAGGVAHDFNNLLTVINGYCNLILATLPQGDPNRGMLTEVLRSGERAATITHQLLAFSRQQLLEPRTVSVNAILEKLATLLRSLLGERVELVLVLDGTVALAKIDPDQFEQAILNLALNARDAMPEGGRLTIETRNATLPADSPGPSDREAPARYVMVSVSDSGQGMDEPTKARIFEPFFTTKGPGKGTGLGLSMVYGFVKQSGAQIDFDTELGKGTVFRIYVPRAEEAAPVETPGTTRAEMPCGTEMVLLVEDEDPVRALSKLALESSGYTVLEAPDAREALDIAEKYAGTIHLLLTDVGLPRMSGHQLAREISRTRPATRILLISGYAAEETPPGDLPIGDLPLLPKPFTPLRLTQKVREVLDGGLCT